MKQTLLAISILVSLVAVADTWTDPATGYTWTYSINDGTAEIRNNFFSCAVSPNPEGKLSIPSSLGGYPVTSIGFSAFRDCSGLTSVTIPECLMSIGECAFAECSNLGAFEVADGNQYFTTIDGVLCSKDGATLVCVPGGIKGNFAIPDSVTSIVDSAFYGCSGLTNVTLPSGVTIIGDYAFEGCSGLTSLTIPDGVTSIGAGIFAGCNKLTAFVVSEGNQNYKSNSGMLLTKDGTTLVAGVNGTDTMPDGVTSIGNGAFFGYSGLTSVTIPGSVTNISFEAFCECSGLVSVTMCGDAPAVSAYAFDGVADGCVVRIPSGNETYEVPYGKWQGMTVEYYDENVQPEFTIVDGVLTAVDLHGATEVTIPDNVTSIGENVFQDCASLKAVIIPEGVKEIGFYAFRSCSSLESVSLPSTLTNIVTAAFEYCTSLKSIDIPAGVTSVGNWLCNGCSSLASVTIPDGVTSIGNNAFKDCSALTEVTMPDSVESVGDSAFSECNSLTNVVIGSGVKTIGFNAFLQCGLRDLTIPDSVKHIGWQAFHDNNSLTNVVIGSGVTHIDFNAFLKCDLRDLTIPDSVKHIGWQAFYDNNSLTNVVIGNGVTNIDNSAFYSCNYLSSVTIGNSVERIGNWVFRDTGLSSVTIPDSVKTIGEYAFCNCRWLSSVTMQGDAPEVGDSAFDGVADGCVVWIPRGNETYEVSDGKWQGLTVAYYPEFTIVDGVLTAVDLHGATEVTIPDSVEIIGDGAFYGCNSLTNVIIGSGVTSIGAYAFGGCRGLKSVTIPDSVTSIDDTAFSGCYALRAEWCKTLSRLSAGGSTPSEAEPVEPVDPRYDLTANVADRSIASLTVDGNTAIDSFVLKNGKTYDAVICVKNASDGEVTLTLPNDYTYLAFAGTDPLKIPAASTNLLTITRIDNNTFLVARQKLKEIEQ